MKKDMNYDQLFATSRDKMKEIMKTAIERCKNDKTFEQALLNNPTETLKKEGLELKPGYSFQIVKTAEEANSLPDNVIPLSVADNVIPLSVADKSSLSVEDLDKIAGGWGVDPAHQGNGTPHRKPPATP